MRNKKNLTEIKTLSDDDIKTSRGSRSPLLRAGVMILSSAAMIAVTACGGTGTDPDQDAPGVVDLTGHDTDTGVVVDSDGQPGADIGHDVDFPGAGTEADIDATSDVADAADTTGDTKPDA